MKDETDRQDRAPDAKTGGRRCPICGKPAQAQSRPFCSRRCADVDLSRWLGGAYRIPVNGPDEEDGDGRRDPRAGPDERGN